MDDNKEVLARLDALEQTFLARLDTIRAEREHGDRTLEQADKFIREQVKENTAGVAQLSAQIERVRYDQQEALSSLREQMSTGIAEMRKEVREGLKQAVDAAHSSIQTASDDTRVERRELDSRLTFLEDKWKTGRGIAIGLGITSVVEMGAIITLLSKAETLFA